MFQLLLAELIFAFQLPHKKGFWWKLALVCAVCFGASLLFPLPDFADTAWYSCIMFFSLFAVTVVGFLFVFNASFKDVLFCAIAGYTVQHIAQELFELANVAFSINESYISIFYSNEALSEVIGEDLLKVFGFVFGYCALFVALYWAAYFLFARRIRTFNILNLKTTFILIIVVFIVIIDVVFSSVITYAVPPEAGKVALSLLHVYNVACCILALILLFEWPHRKFLESEIAVMQQLRSHEKEQYFISKENIEQINIKCHDMRHQLRRFAEHNAMNSEAVNELMDVISIYDATYNTQNEALNVILMEKSLLCHKKKITLSCIVDGAPLGFMSETDVYSLFGNMIENAIEAVSSFTEEKRSIGLSVKLVNNFVIIHVYNYYEGKLRFDEDLPVTSKADKSGHGYGMKSIRNIVEKYKGELNIRTDNGVFSVSIALPVNQ